MVIDVLFFSFVFVFFCLDFEVAGCKKMMAQRRSDVGFFFGLLLLL